MNLPKAGGICSLAIKDPQRLCESLLSIDPGIIYTCILSSTGEQISSAAKPSAKVIITSNDQLISHFKAVSQLVTAYVNSAPALPQGERLFGELKDIVATFGNLRVILILNQTLQAVVALVTLKEADSKKITFQSSKIIAG